MHRVKSVFVKEMLVERKGLNKQRECAWTGRDGGSSAVTTGFGVISKRSEMSEKDRYSIGSIINLRFITLTSK